VREGPGWDTLGEIDDDLGPSMETSLYMTSALVMAHNNKSCDNVHSIIFVVIYNTVMTQ